MLSFNNEKHNLILERIESRLFYKLFVDRDGIGCVDSSDKDLKEADEGVVRTEKNSYRAFNNFLQKTDKKS